MSSQGPKVSGVVDVVGKPGLNIMPASAALSAGYSFDRDVIRDAGDWIKYKKQLLVFNEDKTKNFTDPWFVRGNEYRLTWMQGRSKQPDAAPGCVPCDTGSGFVGRGPF
jgi:hypothetical protein